MSRECSAGGKGCPLGRVGELRSGGQVLVVVGARRDSPKRAATHLGATTAQKYSLLLGRAATHTGVPEPTGNANYMARDG